MCNTQHQQSIMNLPVTRAKRNVFLTEEEFSFEFISALPHSCKSTKEGLCLFKADLEPFMHITPM